MPSTMSTTSSEPGDIGLAEIPFTSGQPGKVRPVLVLWTEGEDCVVCSITAARPRGPRDLELKDWADEGLLRPSTCRLGRLHTMEQGLLVRRIGQLSAADADRIARVWRERMRPAWVTG